MRIKGRNVDMATPEAIIPEEEVIKCRSIIKKAIVTEAYKNWFKMKEIPTFNGIEVTHEMFYSMLEYERAHKCGCDVSHALLFLLYHPKIKEEYARLLESIGQRDLSSDKYLDEWISQVNMELFTDIVNYDMSKGVNITGYLSGKQFFAGAKREMTEFFWDNKVNKYNSKSDKAVFIQKVSYEEVVAPRVSDSDDMHGTMEKDILDANDNLSGDVYTDFINNRNEKIRLIYEAAEIEYCGKDFFDTDSKVSNIDEKQMQIATFLTYYKGGAENWSDEELDILYGYAKATLANAKAKALREREIEQEEIER